MLGGIRKFCDYHFICQFFFKRIVYMHIDATVCGCPVNRRQKKRMLLHPLWYVYSEFPDLEIQLVEFVGESLRLV